jgi:hypothetical protein
MISTPASDESTGSHSSGHESYSEAQRVENNSQVRARWQGVESVDPTVRAWQMFSAPPQQSQQRAENWSDASSLLSERSGLSVSLSMMDLRGRVVGVRNPNSTAQVSTCVTLRAGSPS